MSTFTLIDDIRTHLSSSLAQWKLRLPTRNPDEHEYGPPTIFIGQLPPRSGSRPTGHGGDVSDSDFPFVLVRCTSGELTGDVQMDVDVNVSLICGLYSGESRALHERGVHDLMNLVDKLALELTSKPYWADGLYKRGDSVKWTLGAQKELGVYDAGLQEIGPTFAGVVQLTFNRNIYTQQEPLIK